MTTTTNLIELRGLAEAATPQAIDTAKIKRTYEENDGCIECPTCQTEGHVQLEADYCNYDNTAIGVQFYGIGKAHGAAEAYFRAVTPTKVIELLDTLETQAKQIAELEKTGNEWYEAHNKKRIQIEALQADAERYLWIVGSASISDAVDSVKQRTLIDNAWEKITECTDCAPTFSKH